MSSQGVPLLIKVQNYQLLVHMVIVDWTMILKVGGDNNDPLPLMI